jgi:hypothetical protein
MEWFFKIFGCTIDRPKRTATKDGKTTATEIQELAERMRAVEYLLAKAATAFTFQDASLRALAKQLGFHVGRQTQAGKSQTIENESSADILSFPTDEPGRNPTET